MPVTIRYRQPLPLGWGGGGGGTPYSVSKHREAPPEKGRDFMCWVYKRAGETTI